MVATAYNRYSRYLHWLMAGLIIFMIFFGWRIGAHDSMRFSRANLHKSIGISILLLTFLRVGLRLAFKAPAEPPMPKWQSLAAQGLHLLFYVVMVGMPLSGWLMVSTSARDIPFFGLFAWPHLPVPQTQAAHDQFMVLHHWLGLLIIGAMLPLHVGAALKHQFVDRDNVIEHMVPGLAPRPLLNWRWIVPIGVVVLAIGLAEGLYRGKPELPAPPPAALAPQGAISESSEAASSPSSSSIASASVSSSAASKVPNWHVDLSNSSLAFSTQFQGEAIHGRFAAYAAAVAFDPQRLDQSHVRVSIDLASVATGDNDRDSTLKGDSFFDLGQFPKAVFEAKRFTKTSDGHFVAHGSLTLHGVNQPIDLPFSLTIVDGVATVAGSAQVDRLAFGVGSGDYASADVIPAKVAVTIALKARSDSLPQQ